MPFVKVAESHGSEPFDMYYEVHGSGPNRIVFIGGFGNICHQWDLQVEYFMQEPELFSVCIFDNRGGGLSGSPKGRYKTHEMALDVRDLMDHLQWNRFHVVGLSLGGMIAQELAHCCLRRVISLTLESTFAFFNGLPAKGYLNMVVAGPPLTTVEDFAAHVVNNILFPQDWLSLAAPEGTSHITNREHMIEFMRARFQVTGLQAKAGRASQQSAVVTHSMTPKRMAHIKQSQMPVLVMTGTQDDVIRQPVSSKYLARHLGARLEVFPGAGHAIRLQHPDRHNVLLKTHILGAVRKEQERLDDRLRSALAVLKGVCAGPAYTARAAAIRDEMEREWRRNGGRHHLVVEYGGVNRARRISIRQSLSSLRRKSRGSLRSVALSDSSSRTALHGNLPEKARLNISLSNFATSVQDLFAPAEIEPGTGDGHQMESVVHPSSSTFLSWVFPAFPPLLTIEREIVVDQLEFEGLVFDQQESIRTEGSSGLTDEDGVEISRGESATTGLSFRSLTNFISQFVQGRV